MSRRDIDPENTPLSLLRELVEWQAAKFEEELDDNNISGSDAVDFIGEFREKAKALLAKAKPSFVLLQEGGSSQELYVHAHETGAEADADRISCRDDGSYRTTPVVEIAPELAVLGEVFYEAVEAIIGTLGDMGYPEGDSPEDDIEGWHIYQVDDSPFVENLDSIIALIGSARYESKLHDHCWWIRRVED